LSFVRIYKRQGGYTIAQRPFRQTINSIFDQNRGQIDSIYSAFWRKMKKDRLPKGIIAKKKGNK
jgi:hypothetical protein